MKRTLEALEQAVQLAQLVPTQEHLAAVDELRRQLKGHHLETVLRSFERARRLRARQETRPKR